MGEFSADWLGLREPADRAARAGALTADLIAQLPARRPIHVLDLGAGTGSNFRCLAPSLPTPQVWRMVDRDAALLAELPQRVGAWAIARGLTVSGRDGAFTVQGPDLVCHVETRSADLSRLGDVSLFDGMDLVTGSALLDLVSERWLRALAERIRHAGASLLFALTYDGRVSCSPADPDDERVRVLVNRHQQTTKGFGRALGPGATACAVRCFEEAGYVTHTQSSDWHLGAAQGELQRQLIEGWAGAAGEIDATEKGRVEFWKARRLAHVESGVSEIVVGHTDLAGWPSAR